MCPRKIDKEQKRNAILRAAMQVLARHSVRGFKMIDVAEAAGVGKGTLYEYFPSKDALISGSFGLLLQDYKRYVEGRISPIADPEQKIRSLIQSSCEFFTTEEERLRVVFDLWAAAVPREPGRVHFGELLPAYAETRDWLAGIVTDGIRDGAFRQVDTRVVASLIVGLLDGLMFQAVLGVTAIDEQSLPEKIADILLRGLSK